MCINAQKNVHRRSDAQQRNRLTLNNINRLQFRTRNVAKLQIFIPDRCKLMV